MPEPPTDWTDRPLRRSRRPGHARLSARTRGGDARCCGDGVCLRRPATRSWGSVLARACRVRERSAWRSTATPCTSGVGEAGW